MSKWLGIDFGTCSTRASFLWDGHVKIVPAPQGKGHSFPSAAFLTKEGELLVGHAAELRARMDGSRYRREFKRDIGSGHNYNLGGVEKAPEDLVIAMLSRIKTEAEKTLAGLTTDPFAGVVLTVPATYKQHKREIMERCAFEAGFTEVRLLEEPVAAAMAYADEARPGPATGDIQLIYDLGGGTFDAALLRKTAGDWELLAEPVGLEHCGGIDFDRAIHADMLEKAPQLRSRLHQAGNGAPALALRLTLADLCRDLKHQLSEEESIEYALPETFEDYSLTRAAFGMMIGPLLGDSLSLCRQLVQKAGIDWSQVSGVLLVGGSCRIPAVAEAVTRAFNRPTLRVSDPAMAVCRGAAASAAEVIYGGVDSPPEPAAGASTQESERALKLRWMLRNSDNEYDDEKIAKLTVDHIKAAIAAVIDAEEPASELIRAVRKGRIDVVRLFLEAGVSPDASDGNEARNAKEHGGDAALFHAVSKGHDDIVELLLESGANPNARCQFGEPVLVRAARKGRDNIVRELLYHGADPEARDENGETALLRVADQKPPDDDEDDSAPYFGVISELLRKGADIEAEDAEGRTPLILAAWQGNRMIVRQLIDSGAYVNARCNKGDTALSYARGEDARVIKYSLEKAGGKD